MILSPQRASAATIFNIMRFALHDGPGIRTAVFFKGCPLSCWWCHNPESQSFSPDVLYSADRCRLCGACLDACPRHAILRRETRMDVTAGCTGCATCVGVCAAEARAVAGQAVATSHILAEIERDTVFFDESGGGVTFTGGEPLSQPEPLEALLLACRERRIHTAVETCGAAPRRSLLHLCGLADLVLYDLKLLDPARHRRYTGVPNRNILENLQALSAAHPNVIVRVPVVPGINDRAADIAAFRAFLAPLPIRRIDLLPYHNTGAAKYSRLGREYRLPDTPPPDPSRMADMANEIAPPGIPVKVAG